MATPAELQPTPARRAAIRRCQRAKAFLLGLVGPRLPGAIVSPPAEGRAAFKTFDREPLSVTHSAGSSAVGAASHRRTRFSLAAASVRILHRVSPSSAGCSSRPPRAGIQIHRVLGLVGQMGRAVLHLGEASGSLFETQSWFESFLPLRLRSRRARSSAVGVSMGRSPGPSAPASPGNPRPCPSARCCAAPRWPPWSRHLTPMRSPLTRPATQAIFEPSRIEDRRWTSWGLARAESVTARNGPAHDPAFQPTYVATGNPSSAIPARGECDALEVAHQVLADIG